VWLVILLLVAVIFIVVATSKFNLHPFIALLVAAFGYGIGCGNMSLEEVVKSVNSGFGATIGYIGIVILAGSVIGTFLEKSGGALNLAQSTLKLVGQKNVPLAMSIIGYIVSISVFCDSGFVILLPLCKALSKKTKITLAASAIALSLGLYATHTMVPPTPGPIAAAGLIEADLGLVIMWGMLVSVITLTASWIFAVKFAAKVYIDPDSESEQTVSENFTTKGPSTLKSIIPILLPIVLIVLKSVSDFPTHPFGQGNLATLISFIGQPMVALLIGAFLAFTLPEKLTTEILSYRGWVGEAVVAAATIIIITGCGGAFGRVLQNSGISDVISNYLGKGTNLSIWLPFIIAAALKTTQGSSTVAIITTASIAAPLLETLGLDTTPARALVVISIGAGSMIVSHANDSYFWVVTGFCKMSVKEGYKLQTLGTLVQGSVAAITLWIISLIVL
jgi:GntP family gluconate:H+ symporter